MENKDNTIFYNVYTELENKHKYTKYQKNKKDFHRFLIRISDEKISDLQDIFEIFPCKKSQTGERDNVSINDFTFPSDNNQWIQIFTKINIRSVFYLTIDTIKMVKHIYT